MSAKSQNGKKGRILLVEDEESLTELMLLNLTLEHYQVSIARDGLQAIDMARKSKFDLCILDIMLPKIDGFTVCKTLRSEHIDIPILFLSAKATGFDRVEGLKIGGDDYLTKPFNLEELLLRISNLIRRHKKQVSNELASEPYRFGGNEINFGTFEIKGVDGLFETITKKEMSLLKFLIDREGLVVSREDILENVWGHDVYPSTRTIDNYILAFRKYFEKNTKDPEYFFSIRGVGYKFVSR